MTELAHPTPRVPEKSAVAAYMIELLEEITASWDVGPLSGATELGSLGIESINLVYLIVEVQAEFELQDALIRALRADQLDVRLLRVDQMAELACAAAAPAQGFTKDVKA